MQGKWINRLMLMPATAWFAVMLVLPLVVVVIFSFGERGAAGGYVPAFTFDQYANLPARFTAFKNTLLLAPAGTLAALLVAYPLAYFLAVRVNPKWRTLLLVMVIVPFWTSILIRTYAWIYHPRRARHPRTLLDFIGIEDVQADQHAGFSVLDGHHLRLPAADGLSDLRQSGEAGQAAAWRHRAIWDRTALADLSGRSPCPFRFRASPRAACWCSSCSWESS